RKLLDVWFDGMTETVALPPARGMTSQCTGGLICRSRWTLEDVPEGTRLIVEADATVPAPLLPKRSRREVLAALEADIEQMLLNVKTRAEAALAGEQAG